MGLLLMFFQKHSTPGTLCSHTKKKKEGESIFLCVHGACGVFLAWPAESLSDKLPVWCNISMATY